MTIDVTPARADEIDAVRALFRKYEAEIGIDLCFQGFENELASLPGDYQPPRGQLLIARSTSQPIACVALRPLRKFDGICEMKRLYVESPFRGSGLGDRLVQRIVDDAKLAGYSHMRLDTLESMTAAQSLYRRHGFRTIPAYYANPLPGVVYFELDFEGASR